MHTSLLFAATLALGLAGLCLAGEMPERIDFRKNPAYLVLNFASAVEKQLNEQGSLKCPGYKESLETERARTAIQEKINRIDQDARDALHAAQDTYTFPELQEKTSRVPGYVGLTTQESELRMKLNELKKQTETCINQLKSVVRSEFDFFEDSELTKRVAQGRIYPDHWEVRILPEGKWEKFYGDGTPAGEVSYFKETVFEKRGDHFLIPQHPFSKPVWFDFKKAYGYSLDDKSKPKRSSRIEYIFPVGNDRPNPVDFNGASYVPVKIEGGNAILREAEWISEGDPDEIVEKALKSGTVHKVPLKDLFGPNGHLLIRAQGC